MNKKIKKMIIKTLRLVLLFTIISFPVILAYFGYIKVEIAAISIALILGVLGIFKNLIRSQFYYPEIDIKLEIKPPSCHKTIIDFKDRDGRILVKADCCYYRLKVSNTGNDRAKKIEVMMTEKYTQDNKGKFAKDNNFLPLNLLWSHDGAVVRESIASSLFRYCDLGRIIHPDHKQTILRGLNITKESEVVLDLDLEVKPNTGSHLIFPGNHRIKIIAVADNSKVFSKIFEINFNDFWSDDEGVMLKNGLTAKEVPSLT